MISQENIVISKEEFEAFQSIKTENVTLKEENEWFRHQLAELKRLIYGSKRERFIKSDSDEQTTLFDILPVEAEETKTEEITYTRKTAAKEKKHPLRVELPAHLPREEEVIEPDNLPEGAKKIGEAITEILEYRPANIYVRRIIRPKYLVSNTEEDVRITIANLPSLPIPKGNAGASLISQIGVSKYTDHLPFFRQAKILRRQGLQVSDSTIGGWFKSGCDLIEPCFDSLKQIVLDSDYLMVDETPIPVLTKDKPGSTHKGYFWVYYNPIKKLAFFDYQPSRSRAGPDEMLKNFIGYLQTDGYTAYNNLKNKKYIIQLACMAHARRKFDKAKDNNQKLAEEALSMFQKLYEIERLCREKEFTSEQIKQERQEKSVPVLQEMEAWLKDNIYKVAPKSAIGEAISYTLGLWSRLIKYVEDGRLHIDNNMVENTIRPVALGRKNYLFAGSHEAAKRAAMMYSFLACCKMKDVEPYQWLKNTLENINDYPINRVHELLP